MLEGTQVVAAFLGGSLCFFGMSSLFYHLVVEYALASRLRLYACSIDHQLAEMQRPNAGWRVTVGLGLGALAIVAASTFMQSPLPLLAVVLLPLLPTVWLRRRRAQRQSEIENQLPLWLVSLANAIHATPSLVQAMASTVQMTPPPMRQEVAMVMKEYELGIPSAEALGNMAKRVGGSSVHGAIAMLQIASRSGGSLPETLKEGAASLREMIRLEGVVRTKTAEGRSQAVVLGIAPLAVLIFFFFSQPELLNLALDHPLGNVLLGCAGTLWISAVFLMVRLLAVDI